MWRLGRAEQWMLRPMMSGLIEAQHGTSREIATSWVLHGGERATLIGAGGERMAWRGYGTEPATLRLTGRLIPLLDIVADDVRQLREATRLAIEGGKPIAVMSS